MSSMRRTIIIAIIVFLSAIGGVMAGRLIVDPRLPLRMNFMRYFITVSILIPPNMRS